MSQSLQVWVGHHWVEKVSGTHCKENRRKRSTGYVCFSSKGTFLSTLSHMWVSTKLSKATRSSSRSMRVEGPAGKEHEAQLRLITYLQLYSWPFRWASWERLKPVSWPLPCHHPQAWPGLCGQRLLILIWASGRVSTFLGVRVQSGLSSKSQGISGNLSKE